MATNMIKTEPLAHPNLYRPLCMALAVMCLAWLALSNMGYRPQMILWLGGVALLAISVTDHLPVLQRREALTLAGVTLLALVLRLVNLEAALHRHVDELLSVDSIVRLWDDPTTPLLVPYDGVAAFPRIYAVWQSGAVGIFGPSLWALRVVSVVFGVLSVPALYLLARELFDRQTALVAAVLLAVYAPHLHFSRLGLNNIVDPVFGMLALYAVARRQYGLAGVLLGLTQYFYEGGRLFYPPLVVAFALLHGGMTRERWAALLGTFGLVAAPYYVTLAAHGLPFAPRLAATSNIGDLIYDSRGLMHQTLTALRVYIDLPDSSWFYGGRLVPVLLLPVLMVGLARSVTSLDIVLKSPLYLMKRGFRGEVKLIIPLWLLAAAMGNALLADPTHAPRYVVAFPAIMLVLAVGLVALLRQHHMALTGLLLIIAGVQIGGYFGGRVPDLMREASLMDDVRFRIVDLLDARDDETQQQVHIRVITEATVFDTDSYAYLRYHGYAPEQAFITVVHPVAFNPVEIRERVPGRSHVFFVAADDARNIKILQRSTLAGPFYSPYDRSDGYLMFYDS